MLIINYMIKCISLHLLQSRAHAQFWRFPRTCSIRCFILSRFVAHFDVEEVVAVAGSGSGGGVAGFGAVVVPAVGLVREGVFQQSASFTLKPFSQLLIRTPAVLCAGYQTADATHDALRTRAIHHSHSAV